MLIQFRVTGGGADNQSHLWAFLNDQLSQHTNCMSLGCGRKPDSWREPTHTREEHENSTQKGTGQMVDWNQDLLAAGCQTPCLIEADKDPLLFFVFSVC